MKNKSYGRRTFLIGMGLAAAAFALASGLFAFMLGSCIWGGDSTTCASYGAMMTLPDQPTDPWRNLSRGLGLFAIGVPFFAFSSYACLSYLRERRTSRLVRRLLLALLGLSGAVVHLMAFFVASTQFPACFFSSAPCTGEVVVSLFVVQFASFFAFWACWALAMSKIFLRRAPETAQGAAG